MEEKKMYKEKNYLRLQEQLLLQSKNSEVNLLK